MSIKTLCLGALDPQAGTGYDIKKLFESAFSHFQAASYGPIYPALEDYQFDIMIGEGPVATAIVWGLAFSTVLTLIVVPLLYRLFMAGNAHRRQAGEPAGRPL